MNAHKRVRELTTLATRQPYAESSRRDQASFLAFQARLERRQKGRRWLSVSLALAACAACLGLWLVLREPLDGPLTYQIIREPSTASTSLTASSRLHFSDGSDVTLGDDSAAHVAASSQHGARVVLSRGSAQVSIVPRRKNSWWVEAGPYRVHVTGTAFDVTWSPEQQQFELRLLRGSVDITGPLVGRGVSLRAGQRLLGSLKQQRLLVEKLEKSPKSVPSAPTASTEGELANESLDPLADQSEHEAARPERVARHKRALGSHAFSELLAEGKFSQVVAEAQRLGEPRVLTRAPLADLSALADAARYARNDALARRALLALRKRFPDSESGLSAAYFLARISHGQQALSWYERYLARQPDGTFAAQALGAAMTLHVERGEQALAASRARSYLARFPSGPYASAARKIVAGEAATPAR